MSARALTFVELTPTSQPSDTQTIQHAIDRCAEASGGTVTLRGGTFTSGSVFLKSHVTLRLERDAILKGSLDDADYPTIDTRIAGLEMKHPAALVNAIDCTDVALVGDGTIDGSGKKWWDRFWQYRVDHGKGIDFEVPRPRLVCFTRCQRVHVSGLTLQNPPFWCLHFLYSEHVDVEGLTIRAPKKAPSSDGIDIDSSRDVRISGCDIACDDDCISIKAGRDADGLRVNRPSENVTISDCTFGAGEGVAMGSETAGGIRNVVVRRCSFDGSKEAIRIKTTPGRGGVVENIVYEDLSIRHVTRPIEIVMRWGGDDWKKHVDPKFAAPVPPDKATPIVRGIHLRNVSAADCPSAGVIQGLREQPPADVTFENVHLSAARGLTVANAPDLDFAGLKIDAADGPEILTRGTDSQ
jgi:polygalacturonase